MLCCRPKSRNGGCIFPSAQLQHRHTFHYRVYEYRMVSPSQLPVPIALPFLQLSYGTVSYDVPGTWYAYTRHVRVDCEIPPRMSIPEQCQTNKNRTMPPMKEPVPRPLSWGHPLFLLQRFYNSARVRLTMHLLLRGEHLLHLFLLLEQDCPYIPLSFRVRRSSRLRHYFSTTSNSSTSTLFRGGVFEVTSGLATERTEVTPKGAGGNNKSILTYPY